MANIAIEYDKVTAVVNQLNAAVTDIVPQLTTLKTSVDSLLDSSGGLYLQQTSPAMTTAYEQFNTSLTSAVNGITNFATQFSSIVSQLQSMDTSMAETLNKSS